PNNNGNRRAGGGPTLVCEHCGFNSHTIDRCFKLIGYLANFGKKNNTSNTNQSNQIFNRRFMNINNSVGSSSTSTLSDEQISRLLSLIKDNYLNDNGKGVQANMAGANQYLTYTDKNLVNVIDIYYLRIKVSHPNRTEALITKVARDNKFIVGFDVSKCFLMSQDLMGVKIMRMGKQVGGLYYFDSMRGNLFENNKVSSNASKNDWHKRLGHPSDPVFCHKSSVLAELVHLDLWEPYKVIKHSFVDKTSQDLDHVNLFDEIVYEGPDTPNDDNNLNAQPQNEGSKSSHPGNPIIDIFQDDLGHPQGSNGSADENKRAATSEIDIALSDGGVLNKAFEPTTYWQACKEQNWIEAINKEMKALYDNDT
ncbi:hypothetical protein Tco_0640284, partial [Tanacetum coccineum]